MKITTVQCDISWCSKVENRRAIEQLIENCGKSDLLVLPEMFATGFCMNPSEIAEPQNGETAEWMLQIAKKHDAAVAGSVATVVNGKYFNRLYFAKPDGELAYYDKRHLFTYGGEDKQYSQGEDRVIVDFRGARILLQVCYDLRFPVWSRNRGDYDIAIYVASWPVGRIKVWDLLLRARAVENQCYVVGTNRVGTDPICVYTGSSAIIHPYGHPIAKCALDAVDCATAEIDLDELRAFRKKFPMLDDADKFQIDL